MPHGRMSFYFYLFIIFVCLFLASCTSLMYFRAQAWSAFVYFILFIYFYSVYKDFFYPFWSYYCMAKLDFNSVTQYNMYIARRGKSSRGLLVRPRSVFRNFLPSFFRLPSFWSRPRKILPPRARELTCMCVSSSLLSRNFPASLYIRVRGRRENER